LLARITHHVVKGEFSVVLAHPTQPKEPAQLVVFPLRNWSVTFAELPLVRLKSGFW